MPFDCVIACDHDFMKLSMINTASRMAGKPFYAAGIHGFYGFIFADLVGHEFVIEREKSNIAAAPGMESMTRAVLGVTNKKENDGKNMELVMKQELYCPLILANSSPLPPDVLGNPRKLRAVPPLLPCLRALFDFQRINDGRLPAQSHPDIVAFSTLANNKARELMLPSETLRGEFLKNFIQNMGAEIVPTAAFVGGRLSEDVLNVLGKREQPIQNFAFFDGEAPDGRIYCLYTQPPELLMALEGMTGPVGGGMADDMDMGMGMTNGADFMPENVYLGGSAGLSGTHLAPNNDIAPMAQSTPLEDDGSAPTGASEPAEALAE